MNRDIDKFHEYGYVIITDFLTKDEHDKLNDECQRLSDLAVYVDGRPDKYWVVDSDDTPIKLDGCMKRSGKFYRLGRNKKLVESARRILGIKDIDTHISKFFPMVPKKGFSVDWHQDNFYIGADPEKLISCDVFVNGADKENGCLRILLDSQHKEFPHNLSSHGVFRWIENQGWDNIIDIELDEPFAILFHPMLVHGCYRNTSNRSRFSIAWEYIARDHVPSKFNNHYSQDRLKIT